MQNKKTELKLPPQNNEAEQTVLGSILIEPEAILKVIDILVPADFYNPSHEEIYKAIFELYEKHQPVDVMTVGNRLKENGMLKDVGGSTYLADLVNRVTTASNVAHYAQIVREKKVLRDLIRTSAEITEDAFGQTDDVEELLDQIEQKILSIAQKSLTQNFVHIKDELKTAYERIETLSQGKGVLRGITTGFSDLDHMLSGLQKSDLIILGARPSLGKTSLALDIARNAAIKTGLPVAVFSLEMSKDQVIDRIVSAESGVPLWKLRNGKINEDVEFQMLQAAMSRLSQANIHINDTPSPNILQMRAMARRLQAEHGLGLLVVDYLQLITPRSNKSDNVVQQVTEISRSLKGLARELNVPVLALSQLSREVDKRDFKMPRLSDLRESGSIEQDADVVFFIHRKNQDKMDMSPEEQSITEIVIAKHRNGPTGSIELQFNADCATFKTVEKRYSQEPAF